VGRVTTEAVVEMVGRLPLAVVLLDREGRPVWGNDAVLGLAGTDADGRRHLLESVARAAGEAPASPFRARLPGDHGLIERECWVVPLGDGARLVAFHHLATGADEPRSAEHVRRLEAMLEHTHDLVTVIDAEATVLVSNAAAGRLTGFSGGSVNGTPAFSLVHPDDLDRVAEAFVGVVSQPGVHDTIEVRIRFADDTWHDIEATPVNLLDVPGVEGIVVAMQDVTDRKRAQAYLQSLVENLTDVIVVLDERFEVIWTSPALATIIEAPVETNLGQSAFNDMHPDDLGSVVQVLTDLAGQDLGAQARVRLRLEARPGSGRWRWIEATAVNRLADPHVAGIVCTLRDVTAEKEAADELQAAYERERFAAERLRELDVLKDEFLASVSHEMRTPLAIIIGFADLLGKGEAIDADIQREAVDRIRSSATEMRGMVENLLDYSELEAGRLTVRLRDVPVRQAVQATLGTVRALLVDHPVTVDVPDDLVARADPDALDRILRNLLINAAKFSKRDRPITVHGRREDATVRLEVVDEGVGIAEDQLGLVFERLYRAPGAAFVARGTGVGLNMVRRYVELMDGDVSVRSTLGKGSTFIVRLPAS
jgi:PAS domain S-box-containing protein